MKKFMYETSKDLELTEHWNFCEKNKYPFITVKDINQNYSEIFFDITNIYGNLEEISEEIKEMSKLYNKFFFTPDYFVRKYEEQNYYFKIPVLKEHIECIANQLFDFLNKKINDF